MPRQNEDNKKPASKYSKNIKFSREKTFAYSEVDIDRKNTKLNEQNHERKIERQQNLRTAAGRASDDNETQNECKLIVEESYKINNSHYKKYYSKMNIIVHNLPHDYSIDKLCKTFEQLGSIQFISTDPKQSCPMPESYSAKIVPNKWNNLIGIIQQDIFDMGFSEYEIKNGKKCKITKDDSQDFAEYGDLVEDEDDDDDDDDYI